MSASGRTKVASEVKFGMGASFIELYLWSKFGAFVSSRSGDIEPRNLKTSLQNDG